MQDLEVIKGSINEFSFMSCEELSSVRKYLQGHIKKEYESQTEGGVYELTSVRIGGIEQWLHIRGKEVNNPVLLFLHGGPGASMIGVSEKLMRGWEEYFTVVNWDQRGSGKTVIPEGAEQESVEIMVSDTIEVIQYLLDHLDKKKVLLIGHSWGTVLGLHVIKSVPELCYVYVGIGQLINTMESEQVIFQRAREKALEHSDYETLVQLDRLSPYPNPSCLESSFIKNCVFLRELLSRYSGEAMVHDLSWFDAEEVIAFEKFMSPYLDDADIARGLSSAPEIFSYPYRFAKEYLGIDLIRDLGFDYKVPVFLFSGKYDWQTPKIISDKWLDKVSCPFKLLVPFERSSHYMINEEPGKILFELVSKVLVFCNEEEHENIRL